MEVGRLRFLAGSMAMLLACSCAGRKEQGGDTGWLPIPDGSPRDRGGGGEAAPCDPKLFPFDPVTGKVVCPPYAWPAVFFTPQPYLETLLMGGAIVDHHLTDKRPVFVELLTHGEASSYLTKLGDGTTCPWHSPDVHTASFDAKSFGDARVKELLRAAAALGVTGVFVSDFGDRALTVEEVSQRIGFWLAHKDPEKGISLKGTVVTAATVSPHPDSKAVWDALVASKHLDLRGYGTSADGPSSFNPRVLGEATCTIKKEAWLKGYGTWAPASQQYAIGRHATGLATVECTEHVWGPP